MREGDTIFRPRLLSTLETLARDGGDALYTGSLAKDLAHDLQEIGDSHSQLSSGVSCRSLEEQQARNPVSQ